jgi:hypothetical protein
MGGAGDQLGKVRRLGGGQRIEQAFLRPGSSPDRPSATERYCEPLFFCIFSRLTSDLVPSKMILAPYFFSKFRDDGLLDPGLVAGGAADDQFLV